MGYPDLPDFGGGHIIGKKIELQSSGEVFSSNPTGWSPPVGLSVHIIIKMQVKEGDG